MDESLDILSATKQCLHTLFTYNYWSERFGVLITANICFSIILAAYVSCRALRMG